MNNEIVKLVQIEINHIELVMWKHYLNSKDLDYDSLQFGQYETLRTFTKKFDDGCAAEIRITADTPDDKTIHNDVVFMDENGSEIDIISCHNLKGNWTFHRNNVRYEVDAVEANPNEMMLENYCIDCDDVCNAIVNPKDFYSYKVGRIRCDCGTIIKPCNECENHQRCENCPWENAEIIDAMTDRDFILWIKKYQPSSYKEYQNGRCGMRYVCLINEIENEKTIKDLELLGYSIYDNTSDSRIIFIDRANDSKLYEKLIQFKSWEDVRKFCEKISSPGI